MALPELAVELQLRILAFALDDNALGDPFTRRATRTNLRRVCKAYWHELDKNKEVIVNSEEAGAMLASLSLPGEDGRPVALSVSRLFVVVPPSLAGGTSSAHMRSLIRLCMNVEEIGLYVADQRAHGFVQDTVPALARLAKLKHFAVRGPPAKYHSLSFKGGRREGFLPLLRSLESLTIENHTVASGYNRAYAPFNQFTALRRLSFKLHTQEVDYVDELFCSFPPSLVELKLDVDIFNHSTWRDCHAPHEGLKRLAPQLEEVVLLNNFRSLVTSTKAFLIPRGKRIDSLISRFTSARHLTIPTCAVTEWAVTLKPLINLLELDIVESTEGYLGDVAADDLALLFYKLPKLERVGLSAMAWARWNEEEQREVEEDACHKGIRFVII